MLSSSCYDMFFFLHFSWQYRTSLRTNKLFVVRPRCVIYYYDDDEKESLL